MDLSFTVRWSIADTHTQNGKKILNGSITRTDQHSVHLNFIFKASFCSIKKKSNKILTKKNPIKKENHVNATWSHLIWHCLLQYTNSCRKSILEPNFWLFTQQTHKIKAIVNIVLTTPLHRSKWESWIGISRHVCAWELLVVLTW